MVSGQSSKGSLHSRVTYGLLALLALLLIVTLILAAVAVHYGIVNRNKLDELSKSSSNTAPTPSSNTTPTPVSDSVAAALKIEEVFGHLKELQRRAVSAGGSRTIGTQGFNLTLDYIRDVLARYPELTLKKEPFTSTRIWTPTEIPTLTFHVNGVARSSALQTDFYPIFYSKGANFDQPIRLTVIENTACNDSDWLNAKPYPADQQSVVLLKRNNACLLPSLYMASKYNVTGLLMYNDGVSPDGQGVVRIELEEDVTYAGFFLSYALGEELARAAINASTNTSVTMKMDTFYVPSVPTENLCAWTNAGDPNQTILIGSHSDSVTAGPGINDNGSGTAANLVLATTLARLYQSAYQKYPYRVKFCWWAAEEVGLQGSHHHISIINSSSTVGERTRDYLVYLNYDMLGSSNYMFGVYDGDTADRDTTPSRAIPGSIRVTELFRNWFDDHSLPWTNQDLAKARSDNTPFSEQGIAVGGLFSGAEVLKSTAVRNTYDAKLGTGKGGIAGAAYDTCYHKACDTMENINPYVMEQMTRAAAHAMESLGRKADLKAWLYPASQIRGLEQRMKSEGRQLHKSDYSRSFEKTFGVKAPSI